MKKYSLTIILSIVIYFSMASTNKLFITFKPTKKAEQKPIIHYTTSPILTDDFGVSFKGHDAFLGKIGNFESNNDYTRVNRYGYMGRYQFGKATLKTLGYKVTKEEFLNNPNLQEEAMQDLLEHNYSNLKRIIARYEGKTVHGVYITKSGVLAAAHLAGAGNVRKFFSSGYEFKDGNGTKMTTYMRLFGGYKLNV